MIDYDKRRYLTEWLSRQSKRCFTCKQIDKFINEVEVLTRSGLSESKSLDFAYNYLFVQENINNKGKQNA
jgi:hypothetical protein